MKILHTSDWHLGKKLYRESRQEEHELFLDWLTKTISENAVTHLLIAGDIFDSPNPSHEAVTLYFNFLESISKQNIQTIIIGGNHDSGLFLDAPKKILQDKNIFIQGQIKNQINENIIISKNTGIVLLPYFRNYELYKFGESQSISNGEDFYLNSLKKFIEESEKVIAHCHHKLLFSHHLFGIYQASGSEVAIALSGVDSIPLELIKNFDYVGLGHIHKPQTLKKEKPFVHYSGSPIAMRFSETIYQKSVSIISCEETLEISHIPIPLFRNLISINTTEESLEENINKLNQIEKINSLKNFIEVNIDTTYQEENLIQKIKNNLNDESNQLININILNNKILEEEDKDFYQQVINQIPLEDLFEHFYQLKYKTEEKLPPELKNEFIKYIEKVQHDL